MTINTQDIRPIVSHPYRLAVPEHKFVEEQIESLVKMGATHPSVSSWAAPVVIVRCVHRKMRLCIDYYRKLNAVLVSL